MKNITAEILNYFENEIPTIFNNKTSIRQHQVQMALDVADFLFNSKKQIMFLEAPVGTGKSLGVLIPSLLYTKENKNSILYATSTINLQHQIYDVDSIMLEKLKLLKTSNKILA
ncbi:ATP-dependent DNA helicase, partial [Enterococcus faecalis]|nr:ATP-dependent DNA helicase [Enterococcus faecalis]